MERNVESQTGVGVTELSFSEILLIAPHFSLPFPKKEGTSLAWPYSDYDLTCQADLTSALT